MKFALHQMYALIVCALLFSCQVEPVDPQLLDESKTSTNEDSSFKVDFDNQRWKASTIQTIVNSDYIAITAMKSGGDFFQITIPSVKVGTYTNYSSSTSSKPFAIAYSVGNGHIPFLGAPDKNGQFANLSNYKDNAKIIISEIDTANKTISGSFEFTGVKFVTPGGNAVQTKVFTNGTFTKLSYTSNVSSPSNNSFSAKLDGSNFVPTNVNGIKMGGFISIVGRKGNLENIAVSVPDNAVSGKTYTFDPLSSDARGQYVDASSVIFGGDGKVTITSHNTSTKTIKGTFSFKATTLIPPVSKHDITDGSFDIVYQ